MLFRHRINAAGSLEGWDATCDQCGCGVIFNFATYAEATSSLRGLGWRNLFVPFCDDKWLCASCIVTREPVVPRRKGTHW